MHLELLVDGHFIGGPCDQSIGKTQHYAPYDGKLVGTAAEAGWPELDAALNAGQRAFSTWKNSPKEDRQTLLNRIAVQIRARKDELAQLMAKEIGKPLKQAEAEVERLALTFDLSAKEAVADHRRNFDLTYDARDRGFTAYSERFPIGVVLGIVPYNWPYNLAAHKIGPALAAGNTVVIKAPSHGTLCTLLLGRIIHESGCPAGVVNVLNASSKIAQRAVEDDRTQMLSFTGSPKVGWMLKELVPKKKVALELGGDATAIVTADSDWVNASKQLATASFAYAGQICISVQHILVEESIYPSFKEEFVAQTDQLKSGDPSDPTTDVGPVIDTDNADRIMEWIGEAESSGSTILTGGSRTGLVIEPTIIEGVTREDRLGREEAFAPLVTLQPYRSEEEAIAWVNASQFGIHAGLYTRDKNQAERFFQALEIGGLIVNQPPSLRFDTMPYGGIKNSGFGREGVSNTYHEMTEEKLLLLADL